jgi:hypothetical protein
MYVHTSSLLFSHASFLHARPSILDFLVGRRSPRLGFLGDCIRTCVLSLQNSRIITSARWFGQMVSRIGGGQRLTAALQADFHGL